MTVHISQGGGVRFARVLRRAGQIEAVRLMQRRDIDEQKHATVVRQTMFAEFETIVHELAERGEPLTLDRFKAEYRKLLEAYFGPNFALGPFASFSLAKYSAGSLGGGSSMDIANTAMHEWLQFGVRGIFNL